MRNLLLLSLLLIIWPGQEGALSNEGSPVTVLSFKWAKSRQVLEYPVDSSASTIPAQAMIPANKNFARQAREQTSPGMRDPNLDTIDGRQAALEKNVQDARAPKPKAVDGYAYRVKVKNAAQKVAEVVFWEYQFTELSNPDTLTRRQFVCGVNVKPGKELEIQAFGLSGPSKVVSAGSMADKTENSFQEKVVINRVEYADGTIWQRKDWNFAEIKTSLARALSTPWSSEMCRGL